MKNKHDGYQWKCTRTLEDSWNLTVDQISFWIQKIANSTNFLQSKMKGIVLMKYFDTFFWTKSLSWGLQSVDKRVIFRTDRHHGQIDKDHSSSSCVTLIMWNTNCIFLTIYTVWSPEVTWYRYYALCVNRDQTIRMWHVFVRYVWFFVSISCHRKSDAVNPQSFRCGCENMSSISHLLLHWMQFLIRSLSIKIHDDVNVRFIEKNCCLEVVNASFLTIRSKRKVVISADGSSVHS